MREVEAVARALAKADGIEICSDALYEFSSYGFPAKAAIAALDAARLFEGAESILSSAPAPTLNRIRNVLVKAGYDCTAIDWNSCSGHSVDLTGADGGTYRLTITAVRS